MPRPHIVAVIGAGEGCRPGDRDLALELGERIAREGWIVLSGGRNAGVMAAANEGAKRVGGSLTVGILPGEDPSDVPPSVDIPILTGLGSARNNVIVLTGEIVIACGVAGSGTASEIALALKAGKRVILLAPERAAQALFETLGGSDVATASSVEEAIALARNWLTPKSPSSTG
jgi:uncharacterized protein (TIGR00725 family)